MGANLDFLSRFDSAAATAVDLTNLGSAAKTPGGFVRFDAMGTELGAPGTDRKLRRAFAQAWGLPDDNKAVQDAAADFITSGLERVLGPGEDLILTDDKPYIFVPRPNRPLALESRNLLPPGYRTNSYKVKVRTGQAGWTEPHAVRKLGYADFMEEKKENGAEYYGIKYCYTIPETWESDALNVDIVAERQMAANEALDDFRERVSAWGDANKAIPGMFTSGDALIENTGQIFGGGNVSAVDMMFRLTAFDSLYKRVNSELSANALILPRADKDAMMSAYFGTGGEGPSAWERAVERFEWLKNAVIYDALSLGNATGNASRWAMYRKNTQDLYIEHTETMVFGPFQNYMNMDFVLLRRHGGVVNKRPERLVYIDFTPVP